MKPMLNNPRRISKKAAQRLQADLEALGDLGGIVHNVVDDTLCGGHQRLRVLFGEQAGEFKVTEADIEIVRDFDAPDAQGTVAHGFILWRGFRYAYRRVAWDSGTMAAANVKANLDGGQWDWDALAGWDAEALQGWGFDAYALAQWNDDAANLREMLTAETEEPPEDAGAQVDRAEELQEIWNVAPGDIWRAGEHFIICGDCREPETWTRLLTAAGAEKVNGVFTSPPYAEQRKAQYGGVPTAEYVEWWDAVQSNVRANLAGDGSFFVNIKEHSESVARPVYVHKLVTTMVETHSWIFIDEFCWERTGIPGDPLKMGKFKNQWEPVFFFAFSTRPKFIPNNVSHTSDKAVIGGEYEPTLRTYQGKGKASIKRERLGNGVAYPGNRIKANDSEALGHSASFPVSLPSFFIKAYSDDGDVWLDPFLGSGTTIVAAHKNNRRGVGIEQLEKYVAVTLQRLADLGLAPVKVE